MGIVVDYMGELRRSVRDNFVFDLVDGKFVARKNQHLQEAGESPLMRSSIPFYLTSITMLSSFLACDVPMANICIEIGESIVCKLNFVDGTAEFGHPEDGTRIHYDIVNPLQRFRVFLEAENGYKLPEKASVILNGCVRLPIL